ncbi:MAG TPA: HU family DNA-binding protein [Acidimicrobiia bacterium]
MNRRELVAALAEATDSDKKSADTFLSAFTEVVTDTVAKGDPVAISGFAKFAKVYRAERMGRNPATGEPIKIAASNKVRITPLKAFKDAVLHSKAAKR